MNSTSLDANKWPGSSAANYRPDIDGLRAIAVLAVVFFHADVGLNGGYVGVDIFFTISGYLITGILLKDLEQKQFSLVNFWERRARRILPALLCMVMVTVIVSGFHLLPLDYKELGQSVVAQSTLVSNYYFYTVSGYFAPDVRLKPLLHTWSLAIEEQFYLLFPVLLLMTYRRGVDFCRIIIVGLGVASFALCVVWSYRHAWANFYFLPTRAWELLVGAFLATLPVNNPGSPILRESMGAVGLLGICSAMIGYGPETRMPGIAALLPCGGAMCVIASGRTMLSFSGKLLAFKPLVFIGLISYSLYLWHWPFFALANYWEFVPLPLSMRLFLVISCIGLSILTWRYIERPFRRQELLPEKAQMFIFASASIILLLTVGATLIVFDGFPTRMPASVRQFAKGKDDFKFFGHQYGTSVSDAVGENFVELGNKDKSQPIHVIIWGDSHAMAILPAFDELCRRSGVRGVSANHAATVPLIGFSQPNHPDGLRGDSEAFNQAIIRYIKHNRVKHVVLVASWLDHVNRTSANAVQRGLKSTLEALQGCDARLWIMPVVPTYEWQVPKMLAFTTLEGRSIVNLGKPLEVYRELIHQQSDIFHSADTHGLLTMLDPTSLFTGLEGRCLLQSEGWSLYRDNHHLSAHGASHLSPLFEPLFTKPHP